MCYIAPKADRVDKVDSRKLLEPIDAIIDATMFGLALFDPGCKQSPVAGTCCFGACCNNTSENVQLKFGKQLTRVMIQLLMQ